MRYLLPILLLSVVIVIIGAVVIVFTSATFSTEVSFKVWVYQAVILINLIICARRLLLVDSLWLVSLLCVSTIYGHSLICPRAKDGIGRRIDGQTETRISTD